MNEEENEENKLFVNSEEVLKDNYYPTLLEQYKIYVQMADNISERRNKTNTFFLSINSFLLTLLGILTKLQIGNSSNWWLYVASAGGVTFATAWFMLIRNYKQLNSGKYDIIQQIETKLPIAPYTEEWEIIRKGKIHQKYLKLTNIEFVVPIIFIALYVSLSIGISIPK